MSHLVTVSEANLAQRGEVKVKKYLTPREAYVDFLTGDLSECPLDSKGRLLEQYDGNDYSGNPNNWIEQDDEDEEDEFDFDEDGEIFDPDYHEDYFDVDDEDEYDEDEDEDEEEEDDEDAESDYLERDLWDEEGFEE